MGPLKAAGLVPKLHFSLTIPIQPLSNFSYDSWRTDTASLSEGYSFTVAYRKTPFRVRGGSCDGSRSIGDCRKCQTSTATPAEPGGLPYWARQNSSGAEV